MAKDSIKKDIQAGIESTLARYYGTTPQEATDDQLLRAVQICVRDILTTRRAEYNREVKIQKGKKVYYLCMEFLVGRQLKNNVMNLGLGDEFRSVIAGYGHDFDTLCEKERDPGLGNGGLGRLAACYMDSLATLGYPATGYSILYEYGLFKQKIIDGAQIELPDEWLPGGSSWLIPRNDKAFTVKLGGKITESWAEGHCTIAYTDYEEVQAVPYDLMVCGGNGSRAVNVLRLWKARDLNVFNMNLFSQGQYVKAMNEASNAEVISKVLYPADNHTEGKLLRLTQQYFLVSASVQNIIAEHLKLYGTLSNFADKAVIHVNDTHPALVIPELMRVFLDTYSYSWEDAWDIVRRTVSYTNHTVLPEALETWNEDLFALRLPRIYMIIREINRRFCADLWEAYPGDWDRISRMSVIGYNSVRMANLCVLASNHVNGVSALHTQILRDTVFNDFYKYEPDKFVNVTNGIAHRRWLCYSNPELASFIDESIGTSWRADTSELSKLHKFEKDKAALEKIGKIKRSNKEKFASYCLDRTGIALDPDSLFDVQIKRLHEYKRQLLNCLRIISIYDTLLENPNADITPQTFIFGAKAAPGYYMAKQIIKLIWALSTEIERQPKIREKLRVVFMEDYNVSLAEKLIPAAEISEQISLAGKEASGTGNMKLMMNGALTVGTLDGANVEMTQAVGEDNIYIFGLRCKDVDEEWKRGYNAIEYYNKNATLRRVLRRMGEGFADCDFTNIANYLLTGPGIADPYMCFADFDSYCAVHNTALKDYSDKNKWNRMSLANTAASGIFSSDRSITEYAENIWHINPIKK